MEKRSISAAEITPRSSGFAGARTLIAVRSERHQTKKNEQSEETRYYLSSLGPEQMRLEKQAQVIRGHWGAVENNTHYRAPKARNCALFTYALISTYISTDVFFTSENRRFGGGGNGFHGARVGAKKPRRNGRRGRQFEAFKRGVLGL